MESDAQIRERFSERYAHGVWPVHGYVERAVLGADFGANGYTTLAQADELIHVLGLTASSRLLDLGCGRGWPGVYLAARTGCTVAGVDRPTSALVTAAARLRHERASGWAVAADAGALPFREGVFDAVVHGDVAC